MKFSEATALVVERHVAEWLRAQAKVPGVELHDDPDVTWIVHPGRVWSNAGVMIRFTKRSAPSRLDTLVRRYQVHQRGMGLWVSPLATPDTLPELLKDRGLRLRKRFPAMRRDLTVAAPPLALPSDITIQPIRDVEQFRTSPHPSIGPLTTPLRRTAFESLRVTLSSDPERSHAFVAWSAKQPVGATLVYLGTECAGLSDVDVIEDIGAAASAPRWSIIRAGLRPNAGRRVSSCWRRGWVKVSTSVAASSTSLGSGIGTGAFNKGTGVRQD